MKNCATEDEFWYNLHIFMMKVWAALLVCGAMVSVVAWIVALLQENPPGHCAKQTGMISFAA
ncbi:MAG: hypothetical protein IKK82_01080 [Kiritimatiellae bacterium]|nr:hypothetical protein [Kiritimatiellia bacterium]